MFCSCLTNPVTVLRDGKVVCHVCTRPKQQNQIIHRPKKVKEGKR